MSWSVAMIWVSYDFDEDIRYQMSTTRHYLQTSSPKKIYSPSIRDSSCSISIRSHIKPAESVFWILSRGIQDFWNNRSRVPWFESCNTYLSMKDLMRPMIKYASQNAYLLYRRPMGWAKLVLRYISTSFAINLLYILNVVYLRRVRAFSCRHSGCCAVGWSTKGERDGGNWNQIKRTGRFNIGLSVSTDSLNATRDTKFLGRLLKLLWNYNYYLIVMFMYKDINYDI